MRQRLRQSRALFPTRHAHDPCSDPKLNTNPITPAPSQMARMHCAVPGLHPYSSLQPAARSTPTIAAS